MRVALVTGGSKGIGRACVDAFAAVGWKLVVVDRDAEGLRAVAERHGDDAVVLEGDVSERACNEQAVDAALTSFRRLDAVVGNAGVNLARLVDDTAEEDFDRLFDVNVKALFWLARASHRPLAEARGCMTIVASKTGLVAQRTSPVYCATKGAAVQLARALALDWAPEGIRVNAVCPGIVDTPMLAEVLNSLPDPPTGWAEHRAAQPLGRLATPEECAAAVLWLSSEGASFVTGVALPVDGGFTAE
jgi:NAD(P)-dependent dehydrogenase (short-subunit alcohol dehydrogenase family)